MMQRLLHGACVAAIVLAGCGGGRPNIDWVPFVHVDGRQYVEVRYSDNLVVPVSVLGAQVATVRKTIAGNVFNPHYRPRDGDAAFLKVGTRLRAVAGFAQWFRLGALVDHHVLIFELDQRAGIGATAFDLDLPAIRALEVRSGYDGSVQHIITDTSLIRALVRYIIRATIQPNAVALVAPSCLLSFAYTTTPPITRAYYDHARALFPGIVLSPALASRLETLGCHR